MADPRGHSLDARKRLLRVPLALAGTRRQASRSVGARASNSRWRWQNRTELNYTGRDGGPVRDFVLRLSARTVCAPADAMEQSAACTGRHPAPTSATHTQRARGKKGIGSGSGDAAFAPTDRPVRSRRKAAFGFGDGRKASGSDQTQRRTHTRRCPHPSLRESWRR
jgi:hypothetical protein